MDLFLQVLLASGDEARLLSQLLIIFFFKPGDRRLCYLSFAIFRQEVFSIARGPPRFSHKTLP